jgi:hypothetical protein
MPITGLVDSKRQLIVLMGIAGGLQPTQVAVLMDRWLKASMLVPNGATHTINGTMTTGNVVADKVF